MRVAAATLTIALRQVNPAGSNRSGNRRRGPERRCPPRPRADAADWHAGSTRWRRVCIWSRRRSAISATSRCARCGCCAMPTASCARTRGSPARLLARFGIDKPLDAYHDHNADRVRPAVLDALRRGEKLALVSDAGTPLVSDPGFKLVRAALAEDLPVTAAPGPSAALTALILSGLPPDAFLFAGFLPPRSAARRRALAQWATLEATLIFFEGPSRLAASLADMAEILGDARGRGGARTDQAARGNPPRPARRAGPALSRGRSAARRGGRRRRTARSRAGPGRGRNRSSGCGRCSAGTACVTRWRCSPTETGMARRTLYERALALTREEPEQG